jgi:hypothetical protein
MTTWQWLLMKAVIRMVLNSHGIYPYSPKEKEADIEKLMQGLER